MALQRVVFVLRMWHEGHKEGCFFKTNLLLLGPPSHTVSLLDSVSALPPLCHVISYTSTLKIKAASSSKMLVHIYLNFNVPHKWRILNISLM
jgi:hypothetical protein